MNLIYKVNNINVYRCANMLDNENYKLISDVPYFIPNKVLKSKYEHFRLKFSEYIFDADVSKLLREDWTKIMYQHKLTNVLPILYDGLRFSRDKLFIDYYEKYYGKFVNVELALERIESAMKTIIERLKDFDTEDNNIHDEEFSFWGFILDVEMVVGYNMPDVKLPVFKQYLKKALRKSKKNEDNG